MSVLCRSRELEGLRINALAYQRAVSVSDSDRILPLLLIVRRVLKVIKACPFKITKAKLPEISKLPGLGGKIFFKVIKY